MKSAPPLATCRRSTNLRALSTSSTQSCTKPDDHLKDFKSSTSKGVTTATGTFDEDIDKVIANIDLTLKKFILKKEIKMTIPVSYSPGWPKGDFTLTASSAKSLDEEKTSPVEISGTITANDGNNEEIACMKIEPDDDQSQAEAEEAEKADTLEQVVV